MKLKKVELKFIELMPLEMIETAFVDTIDTTESEHIHKTIASNMAGNSISANAFMLTHNKDPPQTARIQLILLSYTSAIQK